MRAGDRGGDRQPEPGAAARARLVGAREALERARQEVRREAAALVADVQLDAAVDRARALSAHGARRRRCSALSTRFASACSIRAGSALSVTPGDGSAASGRPSARARVWKRPGDALEHLARVERLRAARAAAPGPSARSPAGPRRGWTAARPPRRPSAARPRAPRCVCSPRSASSSSVRRIASGVRSSCEASRDERPLALERHLQPGEHLVERAPEAADLVVGRRHRQPLARPARRSPPRRGGASARPAAARRRRARSRRRTRSAARAGRRSPAARAARRAPARAGRAARPRPRSPACRPRAPAAPAAARPRRRPCRRSTITTPCARLAPASPRPSSEPSPGAGGRVDAPSPLASSTCANASPVLSRAPPGPVAPRRPRRRPRRARRARRRSSSPGSAATSSAERDPRAGSSTAITPVNASVSLNRSGIRDISYATQRPASSAHLQRGEVRLGQLGRVARRPGSGPARSAARCRACARAGLRGAAARR